MNNLETTIAQHENGVYYLRGDSHIGMWSKAGLERVDFHMWTELQKIVREHKIKRAVQLGCNIGHLTLAMIKAGAEVHAFECNPDAIKCARRNCPKADFHCLAIGDYKGYAEAHENQNAGALYLTAGAGEIPVTTLDDIQWQIEPFKLLVMDIEGWEPKALRGGERAIRKNRPIIVLEVYNGALSRAQEDREQLFRQLEGLGYPKRNWSVLEPQCNLESPIFDMMCLPE